MIRVRICTSRCRCQSNCRRSRFSGLATQMRGKRFSSSNFSKSWASWRSVFCLWSAEGRAQLEKFPLAPWASRRRQDLLELLDRLTPTIDELTAAVEQEARKWPEVQRLMTHPGVGPLTALAFVLIIGTPGRVRRGKQVGSYIGLVPSEESSGGRQRPGPLPKPGQ